MTAITSTYTTKPSIVPISGTPTDLRPKDVVSRRNAESSAEIPFGVLLMEGAADNDAVLPSTGAISTDIFAGVVLHEHKDVTDYTSPGAYAPKEMMALMRAGVINVYVEDAVAKDDEVHVRLATSGGNTIIGAFRATQDPLTASKTALVATGMRWVGSASAGGVAELEITGTVTFTQDS